MEARSLHKFSIAQKNTLVKRGVLFFGLVERLYKHQANPKACHEMAPLVVHCAWPCKIRFAHHVATQNGLRHFSWSRLRESNPRPTPYHGVALPAELRRHVWNNETCTIVQKKRRAVKYQKPSRAVAGDGSPPSCPPIAIGGRLPSLMTPPCLSPPSAGEQWWTRGCPRPTLMRPQELAAARWLLHETRAQ